MTSAAEGPARTAYAASGVDVAAGERAVSLLRERIVAAGAGAHDLLGGLGGFGAAMELPAGYARPVLVSATDGVGTKTEIARLLGRRHSIGRDLVAMCADDVVCHGARPLFFLDYVAVGKLDPEAVAELVGGVADGCAEAGCALVGGETAEHPGLMDADAFDLAGFCVGIVEREALIDGSTARSGDVVLGIAASGLHANGYSLVRAALASSGLELDGPLAEVAAQYGVSSVAAATGTLGEALLTPTTIYAPHVLALIDALQADGLRLAGVAHVTGGGLPGNLPRAVGPGLGIRVSPATWPVPVIVALMAAVAGLAGAEMRATFNGGIGMAAVVEPRAVDAALELLTARGVDAWIIGEVVPAAVSGPGRYLEAAS
jgi:phosphoribosylformylglycinamidine cyclo-ligase